MNYNYLALRIRARLLFQIQKSKHASFTSVEMEDAQLDLEGHGDLAQTETDVVGSFQASGPWMAGSRE